MFVGSSSVAVIYTDIAKDVEPRFDTSNCGRPLPKGKNEKVIGFMKDEIDGKIMNKFAVLRAKIYNYLTEKGDNKAKGPKKCVIKKKFKLKDYENF